MGYTKQATKRLSLADLGTDEQGNPFFVDIANPAMLPYGRKMYAMKFAKLFSGDSRKLLQEVRNTQDETVQDELGQQLMSNMDADSVDQIIDGMKDWAKSLILAWNLIDMVTGKPVDLKDADALDRVPGEVVERVVAEVSNKKGAEDTKNS